MKFPAPLLSFWRAWMAFSRALGVVMSVVVLTALWIVGFGLYAIILKLITIPKRFAKPPETYWIDAEPTSPESMKYPF